MTIDQATTINSHFMLCKPHHNFGTFISGKIYNFEDSSISCAQRFHTHLHPFQSHAGSMRYSKCVSNSQWQEQHFSVARNNISQRPGITFSDAPRVMTAHPGFSRYPPTAQSGEDFISRSTTSPPVDVSTSSLSHAFDMNS